MVSVGCRASKYWSRLARVARWWVRVRYMNPSLLSRYASADTVSSVTMTRYRTSSALATAPSYPGWKKSLKNQVTV